MTSTGSPCLRGGGDGRRLGWSHPAARKQTGSRFAVPQATGQSRQAAWWSADAMVRFWMEDDGMALRFVRGGRRLGDSRRQRVGALPGALHLRRPVSAQRRGPGCRDALTRGRSLGRINGGSATAIRNCGAINSNARVFTSLFTVFTNPNKAAPGPQPASPQPSIIMYKGMFASRQM